MPLRGIMHSEKRVETADEITGETIGEVARPGGMRRNEALTKGAPLSKSYFLRMGYQ
jgi:hypothetical protein